jgi:DNA-binding MarR family transcriptional regulator
MVHVMKASNSSGMAVLAWVKLLRAQTSVLAAVEDDLKAAGFPSLSWYDVLLELGRAQGHALRPKELEARLLLAQHNVSRLIDRLVAKNLVRKKPAAEDGRGLMVEITHEGRDLQRRMWPVYRRAIERHVGLKLTSTEAKNLAGLLAKLT